MTSQVFVIQAVDAALRAMALAGAAALFTLFFRRRAAAQHALWAAVGAGMLLLPLLRMVVPPARVVPVPAPIVFAPPSAPKAFIPSIIVSPIPRPAPRPVRWHWHDWAAAAYLAGALLFALRLAAAVFVTHRLLRRARPTGYDGVLESSRVRVPLTAGFWNPRVVLPANWRDWGPETTAAVLAHERAHALRRDPLIRLLAAVNTCVFWFHPLAWWIERRLAVLAEHAADDAALAGSADTAGYARVLLSVAGSMQGRRNRLLLHGAAMDGSLLAGRVRRLLDPARRQGGAHGKTVAWVAVAAFLWMAAALDFQRVVRAQVTVPRSPSGDFGFLSDGTNPNNPTTTAEQAVQLEQQLAANPEDEDARLRLLRYYYTQNKEAERIALVYWLIEHHPESPVHQYETAGIFPPHFDGAAYEEACRRWWLQVGAHPSDAAVLVNAARAIGQNGNRRDEINLRKRAIQLDRSRVPGLARLYAFALVFNTRRGMKFAEPTLAAEIRVELQDSSDAALVGTVARYVVEQASQHSVERNGAWDFPALKAVASELVSHAMALEPQNRDWSDLMTGVNALFTAVPVQPPAPAPFQNSQITTVPKVVRIGAGVAARMLKEAPPPEYPAKARQAGVKGFVQIQVRIGRDGHVLEATLISGHPLIATAAMEAVKRYVYSPLTLDGTAVEMQTTVEIRVGELVLPPPSTGTPASPDRPQDSAAG